MLDRAPYVQTAISIENLFIESVLGFVNEAIPEANEISQSVLNTMAPHIMSSAPFASSDFKSVSYNVPFIIVANIEKDNEMMLLSLDGNETNIQISRLNMVYAGQEINATFSADATEDYSQLFFTSAISLNGIPYSFSGVAEPGAYINVTGDYGLQFQLSHSARNGYNGIGTLVSFPLFIEDFLISFSLDSSFNFKDDKDWIVYVDTLHISETSGKLFMQPSISLSGSIDCYGAMFDNIMYRDTYSTLTGYSSLEWNYNDSILDSASIARDLTDTRNREEIVID